MIGHNIVIIEDHGVEFKLLEYLKLHDYTIHHIDDNKITLQSLKQLNPTILILDWHTTKIDAKKTCLKLFETGQVSIIVTDAKFQEKYCVDALNNGADDYITIPINPRELHARIKAISRRITQKPKHEKLQFEGWLLDFGSRTLKNAKQQEVNLSINEFELLATLVKNPQRIMSRDELYETANELALAPFDRRIDIQISRLRQKIETNPKKPVLIKTVRCGGYLFTGHVTPVTAD